MRILDQVDNAIVSQPTGAQKRLSGSVIAVCMAASLLLGASNPAGAGQAHMTTDGPTSQPIGHYEFCQQYVSDCNQVSLFAKAPKLTRERWEELVRVNSFANANIEPVADIDLYQREEYWTYPATKGDCEDYVLIKRRALMEMGWPASSLLVTVVRRENGEGHAVLTVRTDKADYILDNLEDRIVTWRETPYRYLKRQAANHSGSWVAIRDTRAMAAIEPNLDKAPLPIDADHNRLTQMNDTTGNTLQR